MVSLETLNLTPEFVASFRALGKQVGYRNLGRAIAYSRVTERIKPIVAPNGNGHKPHAHYPHKNGRHATYCLRGRAGVPKSHRACCCGQVCVSCLEHPEHRFSHKITQSQFRHSLLVSYQIGKDVGSARLQQIADCLRSSPKIAFGRWTHETKVECCGKPMGVTPDFNDPRHWRYQCTVNPDHCQDIMITIGPS